MTPLAYADILRPAAKRNALAYDIVMVLAGSFVLALASQLAVRLPFSPVPVTAQTLAVLLVGATLGAKRGSLAVIAYLTQGAAGLPVFAGGLSGVAYMAGPTGGYLAGFVMAAYVTGFCAEKGWDRNVVSTIMAMALGNIAIYLIGITWLSVYVGAGNAFYTGLYPFVIGDILKLLVAAAILPAGWKLIGKYRK
ncbi:MAG: biotin transporter BioY [candidate division Zixibacteria bacterium]|nr:biotin transporter BioY [candidate division Zixibacteria bacterium]